MLNLPFYMASIIPYVHKKDLKRQLNRQFIAKHPDIVPDLTLSKLRKYAPRPAPYTVQHACARWLARKAGGASSLLRRLKETVLSWCFEPDPQGHGMIFSELELATVAMAYIYFESAAHSAPAPMRKCTLALVRFGIFASPALTDVP